MVITLIKSICLFSMLVLVINGCCRVDTDAQPIFNQIHDDVAHLTNQDVYWDSSLDDCLRAVSITDLLKEDLNENTAVQIALLNNRDLQATYESLGIAKAQLAQSGLLKNPVFLFSYRFSTVSSVTDLIDMSLYQNFLELLLIPLKKRLARAELEATKAMVTNQILEVIAQTKIAFYKSLSAKQIWDLKIDVLLANELSFIAAQKLYEVGNITELEVAMERSLYEQAKLDVASAEITFLEAREKLNVSMGLWGLQIDWKLASHLFLPDSSEEYDTIENDAIASSIDLKIAFNEIKATAAGFGVDTTRLIFPQMDIGVSSERDESVWYVGPAFNLAIPLFDFGQANSAKAKARIMQQWNQYTALAVEIRSLARISRFTLLNALRQSRYLEKVIVPLAEQITNLTLLQNNAMQLGVFHLLSAKNRELEKKIQHVQLLQDYWVSYVTLQTLVFGHAVGKHPFQVTVRRYND
ncbi:MAG: TolC family protein [Chlamydiia bacterium]|nr:TolC family protein [Chlamydiia bacterium]